MNDTPNSPGFDQLKLELIRESDGLLKYIPSPRIEKDEQLHHLSAVNLKENSQST